jgi:hypothetical protein
MIKAAGKQATSTPASQLDTGPRLPRQQRPEKLSQRPQPLNCIFPLDIFNDNNVTQWLKALLSIGSAWTQPEARLLAAACQNPAKVY